MQDRETVVTSVGVILPLLSFRKRNQTLEAETGRILFHPTGVCTHVLCCASDRESGAGLSSLISSMPLKDQT